MRVNMDSSIATDPAFRLVAADLGIDRKTVIGACFLVWLACYERRSERLSKRAADAVAEIDGFAVALVEHELADDIGDDSIALRGVEKRIKFLLAQAERGSKGGKRKAETAHGKRQANAKQAPFGNSATATTNTPAPAPDLDQRENAREALSPGPGQVVSAARIRLGQVSGFAALGEDARQLVTANAEVALALWDEQERLRSGLKLPALRCSGDHLAEIVGRVLDYDESQCRAVLAEAASEVRSDATKGVWFTAAIWARKNFENRLVRVGAAKPPSGPPRTQAELKAMYRAQGIGR